MTLENSAASLQMMSMDKLKNLLHETEGTIVELKAEIERRDAVMQHDEIEHLEEHMEKAELSLATIRDFFRYLSESYKR